MTDDMLGPSAMHIKYVSYVYDKFCIWWTNFPGPIESVISKFACITKVTNMFLVKFFVLNEKLNPCYLGVDMVFAGYFCFLYHKKK